MAKKCLLCKGPFYSRNLCQLCYMKELRSGRLENYPRIVTPISIETRVKKTKTCWLWTGDHTSYGYGVVASGTGATRKRTQAHRYVYKLLVGPIPKGKIVMHTCDNPPCVNPKHLKLGTTAENQLDMQSKKRSPRGLRHWNGRLTDEQIKAIRKSKESQAALASKYRVHQSHISRIVSRKSRVHV